MRNRYFITILTILLLVSTTVILIHGLLLYQERLAFIDQQIRETASTLVDSDLADLRKFNIQQAEKIISEELGESRVGKFFIVRNNRDEILFESSSVKVLPLKDIPRNQRWVTLQTNENYIRVLNLNLPRIHDRTLQVGFVVGREFIRPKYFNRSTALLFLSVLVVGLIVSFFSTSYLLRPISKFADFIFDSSENLKSDKELIQVPNGFAKEKYLDSKILNNQDEYEKLIAGFNVLIDRVNRFNKNSKLWAYQMAHELKTPLTLIGLESESLAQSNNQIEKITKIQSIQFELKKVTETISSFLNWAELENSKGSKHLFANKASTMLRNVISRLDTSTPPRVEFVISDEATVFCSTIHLEQLLINLVSNSLKHSSGKVFIQLRSDGLNIVDEGPGISQDILNRLGEPFNKRGNEEGSGLGLAWVKSICKLYDWNLHIETDTSKTSILINFGSHQS